MSAQDDELSIPAPDPCLCRRWPSSGKRLSSAENAVSGYQTPSGKSFSSPEPSMFRPRPTSERTQDISHLLTSIFKNLYTGEVIGKDKGENFIKSRGGDNAYHDKFVDELLKIRLEHDRLMAEADMVERHIIQARARATAEEERALNRTIQEAGDKFETLGLPPVESYFRWCVDNDLLRKHHLICPEDYLTDRAQISRAPEGKPEHSLLKETASFHQHISRSPIDDGYADTSSPKNVPEMILKTSAVKLAIPSNEEYSHPVKKSKRKSGTPKKPSCKNEMGMTEREQTRSNLAHIENRCRFLKNPRFFPPNTLHGGLSLIAPIKKTEKMIASTKHVLKEGDQCRPVPVFLANPPIVFFYEYEVGLTYEMNIELRNLTAVSRHVRVIPPSTPYFAIGLGKFPGGGGVVAPGMSCHYTVRFVPDSLANFEDFILVETQAPYPLLVPIEARRPPPILRLTNTFDCGACLAGGIKILEFSCKNEGLRRGRFCLMPKKAWPPPNFRSIATSGFMEQSPFGIRPSVFQLYPGQSILFEIVFFPPSAKMFQETFTIVCDNCQVQDFTLTGMGQQIAVELISVIGGESVPGPGELVDILAEHRVRFQSLNPFRVAQKKMHIRNFTHVAMPFYWQIMKPNLQPLVPGETFDPEQIRYNPDSDTPFSIYPAEGSIQPHEDLWFVLTFAPKELKSFHSVLHMILSDVTEPTRPGKVGKPLIQLEPIRSDVVVLDLEVKGTTEPFHILLEPYAMIIPGEHFVGSTLRKHFKMWNNSRSSVLYEWEKIIDCDIIQVEPFSGTIEPNGSCVLELNVTGGKIGCTKHKLQCRIQHSLEPAILHIEATFKGPVVSINAPTLDLGLIKLGDKTISTFQIENMSQLPAKWFLEESIACIEEREDEKSQFIVHPTSGELQPLGTEIVTVMFEALMCQRLQTILELKIENGEGSCIAVSADVQTPQVCLMSSHLMFNDAYIGVPAQATVKLFNQGLLPAKYVWDELSWKHRLYCSTTISPASGILGPNEESELLVEFTANTMEALPDVTLWCHVEGMSETLALFVSAQANGLRVTYAVLNSAEGAATESESSSPQELCIDFGHDVKLQSTVKRQLVVTNHTSISAPFMLEVDYFSGCPHASSHSVKSNVPNALLKKSPQLAAHMACKAQSDFTASLLSDGKGAAFFVQPASGELGPFQQVTIDISAYSSMWGKYQDQLLCKVGDLAPTTIPLRMSVKGCPLYFQLTGPQHNSTAGPMIRFGTQVSGGDTISRSLRINNTSPFDIRIDWEIYNQEKDDGKLLDLLVFYGDLFPRKDMDGNEIIGSRCSAVTERDEPSPGWDHIPSDSSNSSSSLSQKTDYYPEEYEAEEDEEEEKEEEDRGELGSEEEVEQETNTKKLISVILRAHEGVPSDYPFCITPRQIVIPARGSSLLYVSFTPLILTEIINRIECLGFALGYMSLDSKVAKSIPGKVQRAQGFSVDPIRVDLQGFVKPALLTIDVDDDEGMVFYSVASDLIPNQPSSGILTETVTTRNLKLINSTETPLYFRLLLSRPFSVASIDPNKGLNTSCSDREEQGQLVLFPQQNMMVKVSFATTLELLTHQNLPEDQMLPGTEVRLSENGDKKLIFTQQLILEYSNKAKQFLPLCAYLSVPVLHLSSETVDFGTCFVGQTRTQEVILLNRSGSKSYWTSLIVTKGFTDAVSPLYQLLKDLQMLYPPFTRDDIVYCTEVTIHGMLGEQPCKLLIRGRGSYDEKYESLQNY